MRRRHALFLIVATLILFAVQAHAQEPVHRVGVLSSVKTPYRIKALEGALRERGYVVGQNLQIEYRFFEGHTEQIPARLGELIAFGPEILVTSTSNSAVVIHATAPAIPMVFLLVADPRRPWSRQEPGTSGRECDWVRDIGPASFCCKALPAS